MEQDKLVIYFTRHFYGILSYGCRNTQVECFNFFCHNHVIRWLNPLLSLGSKRPLEAEDFYGLRSHDSTAVVGDQLQRYRSVYFDISFVK